MFNRLSAILSGTALSIVLILSGITMYQRHKIKSLQSDYSQSVAVNKQLLSNQKKLEDISTRSHQDSINAINQRQSIENKYNQKLTEIKNYEDRINKLNVINDNFLRYIGATADYVPKVPRTTGGADDTTASHTPAEIAEYLAKSKRTCDINIGRLTQLQNWNNYAIHQFNGD